MPRTELTCPGAIGPTTSGPLLPMPVAVIGIPTPVLMAQPTDPGRQQRANERRDLVGDGWRPRVVARRGSLGSEDSPNSVAGGVADLHDAPSSPDVSLVDPSDRDPRS
jgi:hypothetical protein